MQQKVDEEQRLFLDTILTQVSSLNRVIYAAHEYASYPQLENPRKEWIGQKVELARRLVSQATIPRFIEAETFSSVIRDDPFLITERLTHSNAA